MFRNVQCYGFYRPPTFSPLLRFLNFDIIAPLQGHVKWHCQWNVNCGAPKREIEVIQNIKFSQIREI